MAITGQNNPPQGPTGPNNPTQGATTAAAANQVAQTVAQTSVEFDKLEKRLRNLNQQLKEAGGLGYDVDGAIIKAAGSTDELEKAVIEVERRLREVTDSANYLYRTLKEITSEVKNQNNLLVLGKDTFKSLASIAQDVNYYQKGNTDLSEKQLKNFENKLKLDKEELDYVNRNLELTIRTNESQAQRLQARLDSGKRISLDQKEFLKNYNKEVALLGNVKQAIDLGIVPSLERELSVAKQIFDVRRDIAGLAGNAAKLISSFGGPLASFLNVSKAAEAVDDFAKKQIDKALKSEAIQKKLLKIEQAKAQILKDEYDEIEKIEKNTNLTDSQKQAQIFRVEQDTRKKIAQEDEKSADIRKRAIKDTDNLFNRFRALGIVLKELGVGLIKALTDPVTIIGLIIKLFNRAIEGAYRISQNITDVGRALGVSAGIASTLTNQMVSSAEAAGGIFINAQNSVVAIQQLADGLGIAVKFSGKEIANQVKLTELLKLSADEAAKFARISALTNMQADDFVTKVQEGAKASMLANKIHLSDKQVLQAVAGLSSNILLKFQGNPIALGAAVVKAKALGVALEKLEGISESLLDFQSSIEAELEAELMTGRQLNLEQARYAALTGNQVQLMEEINREAGSYEDYQNMNVLAQKSLAKAIGLTREEMAEMYMDQKIASKYGKEALLLNTQQRQELEASGLTLAQYLKKQREQISLQEKTKAAQQRITELLDKKFLPFGVKLIEIFQNLQQLLIVVIDEFLNDATKPFESIADKVKEWTSNSEGFRQKIREWKSEFKENLDLIKNIAIAIGSIFVVSQALLFFRTLRYGFLGVSALISKLKPPTSPTPSVAPVVPTPTKPVPSVAPAVPTPAKVTPVNAPAVPTPAKVTPPSAAPVVPAVPPPPPTAPVVPTPAKPVPVTSIAPAKATKAIVPPTPQPRIPKGFPTGGQYTTAANFQKLASVPTATPSPTSVIPTKVLMSTPTTVTPVSAVVPKAAPLLNNAAGNVTKSAGLLSRSGAALARAGGIIGRGGSALVGAGSTIAKFVGRGGLLSGIFGFTFGYLETKSKLVEEKLKQDKTVLELNQKLQARLAADEKIRIENITDKSQINKLRENTIDQEEYDKQVAARRKEISADKEIKSTSIGAGAIRGTAGAVGAGLGLFFGGPIGAMIGGFLGDALGKWINEKAPGISRSFGQLWDKTVGKISSAFKAITTMFDTWRNALDSLLKPIGGLSFVSEMLAEVLGSTLAIPLRLVLSLLGLVADLFKGLAQIFSGNWKEGFKTLGVGLYDFFSDSVKTLFQPVISLLEKILGKSNENAKKETEALQKQSSQFQSEGEKLVGKAKFNELVDQEVKKSSDGFTQFMNRLTYIVKHPFTLASAGGIPNVQSMANMTMMMPIYNRASAQENVIKNLRGIPPPKINATPTGFNTYTPGLADGGFVTKSGMIMAHAGEAYMGGGTKDAFMKMVDKLDKFNAYVPKASLNITPESISIKTNMSNLDKSSAETAQEIKALRKEMNALLNKAPTPITLNLDGRPIARTVAKYSDLPNGMRQNMSLFT